MKLLPNGNGNPSILRHRSKPDANFSRRTTLLSPTRTASTGGLTTRPRVVALAARGYSRPVDTVIEVRDDLLAGNTGRWHL